jgi:hypothetical protein
MSKELKERFFQQYPKGCPECKGPRRFITVRELTGSFGRGGPEVVSGIRLQKGKIGSKLAAKAATLIPAIYLITRGKHAYFAECESCNEAWVWRETTGEWINTREIQKLKRAKGVPVDKPEDHFDEEDKIGRIY